MNRYTFFAIVVLFAVARLYRNGQRSVAIKVDESQRANEVEQDIDFLNCLDEWLGDLI